MGYLVESCAEQQDDINLFPADEIASSLVNGDSKWCLFRAFAAETTVCWSHATAVDCVLGFCRRLISVMRQPGVLQPDVSPLFEEKRTV